MASELRANGAKWQEIADRLGFTNTGSAYAAAQKWNERGSQGQTETAA